MPQPTQELQDAIQSLHAAIAAEPDPEDKAALSGCLPTMMKVQAKNMRQTQQEAAGGQGPPQGPPQDLQTPGDQVDQTGQPPGVDPRAALLAQLGAGGGP